MSGWKKFQNILIIGLASLVVSTGANAAVSNPQLDLQLKPGDPGGTISGVSFTIDASLVAIILGGGSSIIYNPFESFSLNSDALGDGSLQVGAGGSLLDATFDNLLFTDLDATLGIGSFEADLTYFGGSLAGGLSGGRIEGVLGFNPSTGVFTNFVAKAGPVVPIPAAIWLFGSGLIGLIAFARRKAT